MELRTRLTDAERELLHQLGSGIVSDGLRVAISIARTAQSISPWYIEQAIQHAQVLRGAKDRERARRAVAKRYPKSDNETTTA